jgi:hypothetical protein
MPMAFLILNTADGENLYLDPSRIEAVVSEKDGSRIRTHGNTVYHVREQPAEILEKIDRAVTALDEYGYFNSEPCVSD